MSDKRRVELAIYLAFFALIMCAPLLLDPFWLNRIAKYLVFGMLGMGTLRTVEKMKGVAAK